MKKEIHYCTECGEQLTTHKEGAENHEYFVPWSPYSNNYSKYNEKTGKRNYVRVYKCPNKGGWDWLSGDKHTKFVQKIGSFS